LTPGAVAANCITALAAGAGAASILAGLSGNLYAQLALIIAAVCLDTLDGVVARRFNGVTVFGRYADSISDFIAFGLGGAVIVAGVATDSLGALLGAGWALVTGWRLYRFARAGHTAPHFVGLPSSVAVLCLFALALHRDIVMSSIPWAGLVAALVLAAIMLSPLRFTKSRVVIGGCMVGGAALALAINGTDGTSILFAVGYAALLYTGIGLATALRGGEVRQKVGG
jgi:phosphatidylserine synthase